jgi:hypothetical protein
MTDDQKREYTLYRKACRFAGVERVRKDFLAGDIPSCVTREMDWQRPAKAMGVAVGA